MCKGRRARSGREVTEEDQQQARERSAKRDCSVGHKCGHMGVGMVHLLHEPAALPCEATLSEHRLLGAVQVACEGGGDGLVEQHGVAKRTEARMKQRGRVLVDCLARALRGKEADEVGSARGRAVMRKAAAHAAEPS